MEDLNQVTMTGRLTRDPESKIFAEGKTETKFSIAVNRGKDKAGKDKGAYFFECKAYDKTAEYVGKYLTKGIAVLVTGKLTTFLYKGKNDTKERAYYTLIIQRVQQLSWKDKSGAAPARSASAGQGQEAPPMPDPNEPTPGPDEDQEKIPF